LFKNDIKEKEKRGQKKYLIYFVYYSLLMLFLVQTRRILNRNVEDRDESQIFSIRLTVKLKKRRNIYLEQNTICKKQKENKTKIFVL
jgi:hypothetical protein